MKTLDDVVAELTVLNEPVVGMDAKLEAVGRVELAINALRTDVQSFASVALQLMTRLGNLENRVDRLEGKSQH